ncbi:CaiB/BaiF CoA transferase family protein [Thalassomonas actiniarum]|uniref:CoA transferase n=1 Tax=Thalassomonas actiniarum TaxID=485447 RepID=A0AAF0BZM1_9GAMM|nr:CaiB/BaiF CoA-transferase family protein [Thalassomonas actiniarum]WDD96637.1 CoA transferase [Thalassomonas actiniarum]
MNKPLQGLKVLDFSSLLPGPYATGLLADMGAEVLRIDPPDRQDMVKNVKPAFKDSSYAYLTLQRNKQSRTLDLKQPAAITQIKSLVAEYDILVEQFRPGVMAKLGLDFDTLSAINPELIYCSISGYGQTGPYKDKAGHDINYLALSGLASFSGTKETGPVLSGTQIADIAGGSHHAVMAILAAVIQRSTTGLGQHLDISMTDAAFALTGLFGAGAVGLGVDPDLGGTLLNGGSFYDYYQTLDERYLSVGSLEPKFARLFFQTLGQADWLERACSSDNTQQTLLKQDISKVISQKTLQNWLTLFTPLDACVEPVLTVSEAAHSPLMAERNMVNEITLDSGENIKQIAAVIKFN